MKRLTIIASAAVVLALTAVAAHAQGDPSAGKQKAAVCGACHGPDGNSPVALYPILAGQSARYLYLQLRDFKSGLRKDPLMSPMAANLSREDMLDLAAYFSQQRPAPSTYAIDSAKATTGKQVADAALCTMCHQGGFAGQNEVPRVA